MEQATAIAPRSRIYAKDSNIKTARAELADTKRNTMKKIFISLALALASFGTINAQNVTVKAGTPIPLQIVNPVHAADVKKGEQILFQ